MSETTRTSQENPEQEQADFEFKILNDPEQRKLLMEGVNTMVERIEQDKYTNVIFLDKSARPLFTLCSDLWQKKFPDEDFPKVNFMNIGREIGEELSKKYGKKSVEELMGEEEREHISWIRNIPPEMVMEVIGEEEKERVKNDYRYLADAQKDEDNNVLVVEELSLTGETASLAKKILKSVFPKLNLDTYSLANGCSELFSGEAFFGEYHDPPWRKSIKEQSYGITGVVDDKVHPLTVKPTREQSLDERLESIDKDIAEKYSFLRQTCEKTKVQDLMKGIKDLGKGNIEPPDFDFMAKGFNQRERNASANVVNDYIKNVILPIALKAEPCLEEIVSIGSADNQDIVKIADLLDRVRAIDAELLDASRVWAQMNGQQEKTDSLSIFNKIVQKNDMTKHSERIGSFIQYNIFAGTEFMDKLTSVSYIVRKIEELNSLKDSIASTDYGKLVVEFREELHHAVDEYWEKHQNRN